MKVKPEYLWSMEEADDDVAVGLECSRLLGQISRMKILDFKSRA